jgi:tetratricopeptide (TPR) repeat protein
MRRKLRLTLFALACLLLAAPTASAKDTWTSVRSPNFLLVGNASDKEIRQVATQLEQFRDVFTRLFPAANFKSPVPTTVVVFKSDSSYKPFKPVVDGKIDNVAGYFQPGEEVNYITLTTERNGENPFSVIYHEYTHQLVNNTLRRGAVPPWFNEGLAEYYSAFEISEDRKVSLGNLIENHLIRLREQKLIPLKQLLEVNDYSLDRNKQEAKWMFYAESWALVHYLILGNEGRRLPQLGKFIDLLAANTPTEKAFTDAFQTDIPSMEKELKDYVQQHRFKKQVATFKQKLEFDSTMKSALLTDAEAEAYLGDLLAHTHRDAEAAARLEHALQLDPKLSLAHASLGTLLARQKRYAEAKQHLSAAVASDAQSYLAHYYYAYALSREGMEESGRADGYSTDAANEMREHLLKAIELKPDFAESYHLLAFVDLVTNTNIDEGVAVLNHARQLAPGNEHYAFVLSQLYLRQEKYDLALKTIEPLTRDNADPQLRAGAQMVMNSIRTFQQQMESYKAAREAAEKGDGGGAGGEQPRLRKRDNTADDERAAAQAEKSEEESRAEAIASAINEALRKPVAGETRVRAVLTRIECSAKGLVFVFKVGEQQLRLSAKGFEELHIMAFTNEAGSELSCGPRKNESPAVITYRASTDARAKTDGSLVALEFVPANFQLK